MVRVLTEGFTSYFKIRHLPLMTKLNFDWMDLDVFEINHLWEWTLPYWRRIPLDHPHENWFGNALNFRENHELNHEKQSPHEALWVHLKWVKEFLTCLKNHWQHRLKRNKIWQITYWWIYIFTRYIYWCNAIRYIW